MARSTRMTGRTAACISPAFFFIVLCVAGCAELEYRSIMQEAESNYFAGNLQPALNGLNAAVELKDDNEPLYRMERALVNQRLGNFKAAQEDLMRADQQIEVLYFTDETVEDILQYTISDSATIYRGQPHEKILLNTLNILNFIGEGDLTAARIEARRAGEMYDYQVEVEEGFDFENALTMMLFGLVFDCSFQPNNAYVAYKKAFSLMQAGFLKPRLIATARAIGHSDLAGWVEQFGQLPPSTQEGTGTLLVAVMNGQAPVRVDRTIQVPAPLMGYTHKGVSLKGVGKKTIRFPELVRRSHCHHGASVQIDDDAPFRLWQAVDIESQAMARFEAQRPRLIAAAVSRLLIRCAASTAVMSWIDHEVKKKNKKGDDEGLSGWERYILEALLDAALASMDIPDTRCWRFLPAEVLVGLESVPAGEHRIVLQMEGGVRKTLETTVTVQAGRLALAQFFVTE